MQVTRKSRDASKYTCCSQVGHQYDAPIDLHSISRKQENPQRLKTTTANIIKAATDPNSIGKWLPMVAEKYMLSANLEDYVCVPVVIMPSDLPNRNGIAFPYRELVAFNPDPYTKKVAYQTWESAPTFYEHNNSDYTQAKGVVFAATMMPIEGSQGGLYKLITLCGFDRTKDSRLHSRIMRKELSTYSMGAYVNDYLCSICGTRHSKGGCEHVSIDNPTFRTYETKYGPKLAYYETEGVCGFEVSAVETPAYVSAQNEHLLGIS